MKKKSLNDRLAEREKPRNAPIPRDNDRELERHSAAFRRHFKDYVEFVELDEDGHTHLRRVYQGLWHIPALSRAERLREKLLLALLFAAGLVLFLFAALRTVPANRTWFLAVAHFAVLAAAAYTLTGLYNHLTAGEKLTTADFGSGPRRVRIGALGMAGLLSLCALLYLLCAFLYRPFVLPHLLCAALSLAAALALFAAWYLEGRVSYTTEQSTEPVPDDAIRIE